MIAFSNDSHEELLDLIRSLKDLDVQIDIVPRLFEVIGTNVGVHPPRAAAARPAAAAALALGADAQAHARPDGFGDRPARALAAPAAGGRVAIKLDSRGPVFFRQVRMG